MLRFISRFLIISVMVASGATLAPAQEVTKGDDGKYFNADDVPTYRVGADGTVDWFTYSGFRRYNSECHVCHGPDGMGSSFAPALAKSLKKMAYYDFLDVVVNGRENISTSVQNKMPSFGLNRNVMCYLDDIYVYLKARADGVVGRGRPPKKEAKTSAAREEENACMEG